MSVDVFGEYKMMTSETNGERRRRLIQKQATKWAVYTLEPNTDVRTTWIYVSVRSTETCGRCSVPSSMSVGAAAVCHLQYKEQTFHQRLTVVIWYCWSWYEWWSDTHLLVDYLLPLLRLLWWRLHRVSGGFWQKIDTNVHLESHVNFLYSGGQRSLWPQETQL